MALEGWMPSRMGDRKAKRTQDRVGAACAREDEGRRSQVAYETRELQLGGSGTPRLDHKAWRSLWRLDRKWGFSKSQSWVEYCSK